MGAHEVNTVKFSTERPKEPEMKMKMKKRPKKNKSQHQQQRKTTSTSTQTSSIEETLPKKCITLFLDSAFIFCLFAGILIFRQSFKLSPIYCLRLRCLCLSFCLKLACTFRFACMYHFRGGVLWNMEHAETYYTFVRTIPNE